MTRSSRSRRTGGWSSSSPADATSATEAGRGRPGLLSGPARRGRARDPDGPDGGRRWEQGDLPGFVTEGELLATIRRLNRDPEIHGIIVQLPVPKHISELAVQTTIDPRKDVDGLHPLNVRLMVRGEPSFPPATPYGIVELLLRSGVDLEGAEIVVAGYGDLVGAPLSMLLAQDSLRGNATVTVWHLNTRGP